MDSVRFGTFGELNTISCCCCWKHLQGCNRGTKTLQSGTPCVTLARGRVPTASFSPRTGCRICTRRRIGDCCPLWGALLGKLISQCPRWGLNCPDSLSEQSVMSPNAPGAVPLEHEASWCLCLTRGTGDQDFMGILNSDTAFWNVNFRFRIECV